MVREMAAATEPLKILNRIVRGIFVTMMCDFGGEATAITLPNMLHQLVRAFVLPTPLRWGTVPITRGERRFMMRDMAPSAEPL